MYLVVLLATFMSAIYGYNLSARSDYDRDIPKKKASALIYRFIYQHDFATQLLRRVRYKKQPGHENPVYILPNDVLYADTSGGTESDFTMMYKQTHPSASGNDAVGFLLRESDSDANSKDYMQLGMKLISGNEMASKVLCLDRLMTCTNADNTNTLCKARDGTMGVARDCQIEVDPYDTSVIKDTCCVSYKARGGLFLVSFMKLDARWMSRVTGTLSYDFWRALEKRSFTDNIGVVTWENGAWQFNGRMKFGPAYKQEAEEWGKLHPNIEEEPFPTYKRFKTNWTLPVAIFTRDFFKVNGVNFCDNGCLFRIRSF